MASDSSSLQFQRVSETSERKGDTEEKYVCAQTAGETTQTVNALREKGRGEVTITSQRSWFTDDIGSPDPGLMISLSKNKVFKVNIKEESLHHDLVVSERSLTAKGLPWYFWKSQK